jgi:metaxin
MELQVWGRTTGLPSIDAPSLAVLVYAQLSQFKAVNIVPVNNPSVSSTGELPVLRNSVKEAASHYGDVIAHLRARSYNIDQSLSRTELADTSALVSLVDTLLWPAMLHTAWLDKDNYAATTRVWISQNLRFPFTMLVPRHQRRRAEQAAAGRAAGDLMESASKVFDALTLRLGRGDFFFGEAPTFADVVIAAHVAVCARLPHAKAPLRVAAEARPALVAHADRVLALAFGSEAPAGDAPTPSASLSIDPNVVFGAAVLGVMVGYAALIGLPRRVASALE